MIPLQFNIKIFVALFAGFIFATIVGTLSHEVGHYAVAKFLGYDASINYAFTGYKAPELPRENVPKDQFYITLGGPLQTMILGSTGLLLLLINYRSYKNSSQLNFVQLLPIFLTLFWLRPAANLATGIAGYFVNGRFPSGDDESKMASYLEWPQLSILLSTALMGLIVLALVVKFFVPKKIRLTFLSAGLAGGAAGYILWLHLIGPVLLP